MLDFPEKTFFNRVIPKAKFYEKLPVTQAVKNCFVNEIAAIVWRNKLSAETLNVQPGSRVREIEVIEITLKGETLNDSVLKLIDKGIPYQLLFMLKRGDECQLCIGYKETETASVKEYFKTPWQTFSELPLQINGLTLDEVCDNFIRQINTRLAVADAMPLKEALADDAMRQKIEKKIALLEKKMKAEKQPKRKFELHEEMQKLRILLQGGSDE
jgi:predicted RNA-binding protein with RPS1 domain